MNSLIYLKNSVDRSLLVLIIVLMSLGLVMLTSASIAVADQTFGEPFYYLFKQLTAVIIGLVLGVAVLMISTEIWFRFSSIFIFFALVSLVLVLIPGIGREVNGAMRWISIAGINFQVSEAARLAMLMYLSGYMVRHRESIIESFAGFLRPMLLVFMISVLLLAEPDFGALFIIVLIAMSLLFLVGAKFKHFIFLSAVLSGLMAVAIISAPYRLQRLLGYQNPWDDPFGSGFQLTQSLIAIGSGKWFGVGLGNSVQKLFYLPEAHTDFVFAVFAEEFGLVGTLILIFLFSCLVWRGLKISNSAAALGRYYQAYLAFGIAVWQGMQVFINLGVNMGMLPTKGLTLPLISYGRSSLIITLLSLALLLRIDIENRDSQLNKKPLEKKQLGRGLKR